MPRLFVKLPTRLIALWVAISWSILPVGATRACACGEGCTAKASAAAGGKTPGCCRAPEQKKQASCCSHHAIETATACCCERPGLARTECSDCGCVSVPTSPAPARTAQPDALEAAAPVTPVVAWLAAIPPAFDLQAANAATFFAPQPPARILFSVWRN